MISKTKIKRRTLGKTDKYLVETINAAMKNSSWTEIAGVLSSSTRKQDSVNLKEIESETSEGDSVVVLGRVLGVGDVSKKIRVCALGFSESAREKIVEKRGEAIHILEEIKSNPEMEGVRLIK